MNVVNVIILIVIVLALVYFGFNAFSEKDKVDQDVQNENRKITAEYGTVVMYKDTYGGLEVEYPDFTIKFIDVLKKKTDFNPNLSFTYYNFEVVDKNSVKQNIKWSSGTGDISPIPFFIEYKKDNEHEVFNSYKRFHLELMMTEEEQLKDGEMVITDQGFEIISPSSVE